MKIINLMLTLLVIIATVALIIATVNGNAIFGVTGLSLIYFAGAGWYFLQSYTFKKRS